MQSSTERISCATLLTPNRYVETEQKAGIVVIEVVPEQVT